MDRALKRKDSDEEFEQSQTIKDSLNSIFSKNYCRKIVSSGLKELQNQKYYQKDRLHIYLIRLMHIIMFPPSKHFNKNDKVCLTQMSAKKGIEKFGERALNANITEYEQFENLSVFTSCSQIYAICRCKESSSAPNRSDKRKKNRETERTHGCRW